MRTTLLVALLVVVNLAETSHAGDHVVLTTNVYKPYVMQGGGVTSGVCADIVRAVFHELKMDTELRCLPWQRGQIEVRRGGAFAGFPYMATAARGKHFDFSDPVIGYSTRFFYMKDAHPDGFDWKELADFKPYKIGGVRGYWYEDAFVAAELNVHFVSTDIQIIQLLTKGRIDFTLMDELAGWALIEEMYPGQKGSFAVAEKPESSAPLRLMVSRKYPDAGELTARFNKGLKTVMKNGTYDKILQHYGVPPKYAISE